MTMHTAHPDIHEAGLADGCPRCEEYVHSWWDLDEGALASLVMLAVDRDRFAKGRSDTELVAAAQVLTALERVGRMYEVAPAEVLRYLDERWGGSARHSVRVGTSHVVR